MHPKIVTLSGNVVDDWTYKNADTQYLTHGLHPYPARMIPQIANRLISDYSGKEDWILDPFCGSGTVLVESMLKNRNSVGNEINPLAILLTKVKTTPLNEEIIRKLSKTVLLETTGQILNYRKRGKKGFESITKWTESDDSQRDFEDIIDTPKVANLKLWFKDNIIDELAILRKVILSLDCKQEYRDLFRICLSFTAMKTSNADFESHQSHPSRYKPEKLETFSPDVLSIFREKLNDSIRRVVSFSDKVVDNEVKCHIISGDARKLDLSEVVPRKIDLIVTSPPYGEEQNTIGYHRWARIMAYWLGFSNEEMNKSEKLSLGALSNDEADLPSKTGQYFIDLVEHKSNRKNGKNRAASLANFFKDYNESIIQMAKWTKPGAIIAIVVGNRLVAGHRVAMDKVTVELASESGITHLKTFYRDIPNTIMPKRIPEGETIAKESIIILEKM